MSEDSEQYFRRRAEHARLQSSAATDPHIAAIHGDLAARYEEAATRLARPNKKRLNGKAGG
jgi:hypothetical protein